MLLAVNIGNSNIRFGVWKDKWIAGWTLHTLPYRSAYEYAISVDNMLAYNDLKSAHIGDVAIASVVPQITATVQTGLRHLFQKQPLVISTRSKTSLTALGNPVRKELGADLLANAEAAFRLYKKDVIVVDFGTALTHTVVDKTGDIKGVIIAPGVKAALQSLVENTAQLPHIEIEAPPEVIGTHTTACIQSGIVYGFLSMAEGLIDRIDQERGQTHMVLLTGGMSHIFRNLSDKFDRVDKLHTLEGIRLIWALNKG